jgi:hypothetical protein
MPAKVTVVDHGYEQLKKDVASLKGRSVRVGIMGGGEVLEYAMYNEMGTRSIPPRPFMQQTFDQNQEEMNKFIDFLADQVLAGKADAERVLRLMGETYQMKIQETIRNAKDWAIPNNPETIKQKGSSSPLIDTGRMVGSVRYEVL